MTLQELKEKCEEQGFEYAYGLFKTPVEPPHLVAYETGTDNFFADNKTFYKKTPIKMDYTFCDKNQEEQNKIEDEILKEVSWNKTEEVYLPKENIWQVSYFFEI